MLPPLVPQLNPGPTDPALDVAVDAARTRAAQLAGAALAGYLTPVQADARLEATFWIADAQLATSARRCEGGRAGADAARRALDLAFCELREELGRLIAR